MRHRRVVFVLGACALLCLAGCDRAGESTPPVKKPKPLPAVALAVDVSSVDRFELRNIKPGMLTKAAQSVYSDDELRMLLPKVMRIDYHCQQWREWGASTILGINHDGGRSEYLIDVESAEHDQRFAETIGA